MTSDVARDLRSDAMPGKRFADKQHKWTLGETRGPGDPEGTVKPAKRRPQEQSHKKLLPGNSPADDEPDPKNNATAAPVRNKFHRPSSRGRGISSRPELCHEPDDADLSDDGRAAGVRTPRNSSLLLTGAPDGLLLHNLPLGSNPAEPPDSGVFYSFDAKSGPQLRGTEVLAMAMSKAVAAFEDKLTVKLAMDEYEIISLAGASPTVSAELVSDELQDDGFALV